eukprot:gnl/TRDRNA2_/TRDRNA2_196710_c0_seq1.p1 gnl/TRDRNA2_/TRDRNA2_196710_c0~~gnl/TRDRNA2_/TRDRNA2_196710_c0_seq1.p1  ORF type:complete len:230 (+),score=25.94 gnl/TRDRNA2_/TRDRNA2_196710_c0_seq1:76-765(+)
MSALVRITTGIMPQHSRVGMTRAMSQFGEVIHCHKPPYSGIAGEDFVNVRFANQDAADRAYAALKEGTVYVDGFQVGVGGPHKEALGMGHPALTNGNLRKRSESPPRPYGRNRQSGNQGGGGDRGGRYNRSPPRRRYEDEPNRANFPSRNDPKSPSPRRIAREARMAGADRSRSRSRGRKKREERFPGIGNDFQPGMPMRTPRPRTPSPDPPGPIKNLTPVRNPFYLGE